jgi:predicted phosphodiesterase
MVKLALTSDLHYGCTGNSVNKIQKMFKRLAQRDFDVLILAGDLASHTQHQYKRCLETARDIFPDKPILTVRGNHDMWDGMHRKDQDSERRMLYQIYDYHEKIYKFNNIHHLDEPYKIGDVTLFGFDGWYHVSDPGTNDKRWMPLIHEGCPTGSYLSAKSFKDFERVLDQYDKEKNTKNILVSHFPSITIENDRHDFNASPRFLPEIKERFDIVCYGHSHRFMDQTEDDTRFLNSGSDYGKPKYLVFEI